jgi:hypothetical protein
MMRSFVRWLAPLLLLGVWALPCLAEDYDDSPKERTPAFQYGLAITFTLITLVIVCMPTRKGTE